MPTDYKFLYLKNDAGQIDLNLPPVSASRPLKIQHSGVEHIAQISSLRYDEAKGWEFRLTYRANDGPIKHYSFAISKDETKVTTGEYELDNARLKDAVVQAFLPAAKAALENLPPPQYEAVISQPDNFLSAAVPALLAAINTKSWKKTVSTLIPPPQAAPSTPTTITSTPAVAPAPPAPQPNATIAANEQHSTTCPSKRITNTDFMNIAGAIANNQQITLSTGETFAGAAEYNGIQLVQIYNMISGKPDTRSRAIIGTALNSFLDREDITNAFDKLSRNTPLSAGELSASKTADAMIAALKYDGPKQCEFSTGPAAPAAKTSSKTASQSR